MSSKNALQEYFQTRHLPLPKYVSCRCGGSDHQPLWQSKVTFWSVIDNDFKEVTSDIFGSKIKAEISAADLVLNILTRIDVSTKGLHFIDPVIVPDVSQISPKSITPNQLILHKKRTVGRRTALFVDVENLPKFINEVVQEIEGIDIYAFIGYHHCLSEKTFPENVIKVLSPSTRADGSDTCMQVYIGYMLAQEKYNTYFIATRDHYGSALVEMITTDTLLWKKKDAKVVTQVSHI